LPSHEHEELLPSYDDALTDVQRKLWQLFVSGDARRDLREHRLASLDALSALERSELVGDRARVRSAVRNHTVSIRDVLRDVAAENNAVLLIPTNSFFADLARNQVVTRCADTFAVIDCVT
jgi:hypothetical protein